MEPTAPTPPPPPGGGIADTLGAAFYGDRWDGIQSEAVQRTAEAARRAGELQRLELLRTRIETAQAAAVGVLIVLAGIVGVALLVIVTTKVATL